MTRWGKEEGENNLWLLTEEEFNRLPDGIVLESITGSKKTKGKDEIDTDTRFGHMAFGVRDPFNHKEKHLFLIFKLTQ
jgi:hypothetical protein